MGIKTKQNRGIYGQAPLILQSKTGDQPLIVFSLSLSIKMLAQVFYTIHKER